MAVYFHPDLTAEEHATVEEYARTEAAYREAAAKVGRVFGDKLIAFLAADDYASAEKVFERMPGGVEKAFAADALRQHRKKKEAVA